MCENKRNRIPVATARKSASRVELVKERGPVNPWEQARRHAELSRLYVALGMAERMEECFTLLPNNEAMEPLKKMFE